MIFTEWKRHLHGFYVSSIRQQDEKFLGYVRQGTRSYQNLFSSGQEKEWLLLSKIYSVSEKIKNCFMIWAITLPSHFNCCRNINVWILVNTHIYLTIPTQNMIFACAQHSFIKKYIFDCQERNENNIKLLDKIWPHTIWLCWTIIWSPPCFPQKFMSDQWRVWGFPMDD